MAENKNDPEKSPSGSVTFAKVFRKLSMKKTKEKDAATPDGTAFDTQPDPPDSQKSPTAEGALVRLRKSFKLKRIPEIFKSIPEQSTDTYNIPLKPLSVMEIYGLIEIGALDNAYSNILSLENEVQCEKGEEVSPVKLGHKEKDLNLLYKNLKDKLSTVICESCDQPSYNKELVQVVHIFQDKEKRGGNFEEWRNVWRTAVKQGVKEMLGKIPPNNYEQNGSGIRVHLELLGKKIVELLEMVKAEILNLYPPSFLVFETYASSCHEFVGEHLKKVLGQATELKDYNALLDFVINQYHSEMILGSPSLQPEIKEQKFLTLSDDLLGQIKKAYFDCLQENLHASLGNVINTEQENVWKKKVPPMRSTDGILLTSKVYTDVCEMIREYSDGCAKIDKNLEKMAVCKCMEALKDFLKRFEEEFSKQSRSLLGSNLLDSCLWAEYHISYINSFSSLKEDMEGYREKCSDRVEELIKELDGFIDRLRQTLLEEFKAEIAPFLGGLMTKNWLNTDTDFNELVNRIETYSAYSKSMTHSHAQSFANEVHYQVVKGYISELLMSKYSCKGRKNEEAADKINDQWTMLNNLFREMGSTLDWLHSLGFHISKIIEQKNEKDIKNVLTPLVENYQDISKKQFSAILSFRDSGLKFERSSAIQCFTEIKRKLDNNKTENPGNHIFFSDIK